MRYISVLFIILFTLVFIPISIFAAASDDFLVELGESYLQQGFLEDARIEFKKALIVNPNNEKAKAYLEEIRQRTLKKELGSLLDDIEKKAKQKARESRPKEDSYPAKKVIEPKPAPVPEGAFPVASFDPVTGEIIEMVPEEEKTFTGSPFPVAVFDPSTGEIIEIEAGPEPMPSQAPFPIASFDPYSGEIIETKAKPKEKKVSTILDEFAKKADVFVPYKVKKGPLLVETPEANITGEYQVSMGIEGDDIIWRRANWDLNEKNWRVLSHAAFNRQINTFDPGIYSAIRFEVDTPEGEKTSLHADIDISPWSFVGKSDKVTASSSFFDTAEIQFKYWGNTGYTINEIVYSDFGGSSLALPEVKVSDWETQLINDLQGVGIEKWDIPAAEIEREYWPLREAWFDYNREGVSLRVFPVALQDQAYTSDDILRLSNNAMYWEESPWLSSWAPGNFNSAAAPTDFSKGRFDDSLAFFTRNSRGEFLTNLRGMSLSLSSDYTTWDIVGASPKTLWQDYDSFDTFDGASRLKHRFADNFEMGGVYAAKAGYEKGERDATIQTAGVDISLGINYLTKISMEAASSKSSIDRTTAYETEKRGNAWKFRLVQASEGDVFNADYFGLKPNEDSNLPFYRLRLEFTHMDEAFETGLSSYIRTRDDSYWSRHIHFGDPLAYFGSGFYEPTIGWNDIEPFRFGDGVDYGRDVVGLRIEGSNFLGDKCDWLFDMRNVHLVDGKYFETVSRLESTYRVNNRLTAKLLGIYHDKPDTVGGIDPYVIDVKTGDPLLNDAITDGEDPSTRTFSAGAEYKLNDNFSVWGIWEHTNDYSLAYDNFPRGILNDSGFGTPYYEDGNLYRPEITWLYGQTNFPLPPYDSYDISKAGMNLRLSDQIRVGIDWTYNEYKFAGPIDNNMNHSGFELEFTPTEKLSYFFRYVYSRWMDINQILYKEPVEFADHHNFFGEVSYRPNPSDEFILQYGVYPRGVVGELLYDPYGGTLSTLDTQHMVRLYYRKKF